MKNLLLFIAFTFMFSSIYAQKAYWNCVAVEVDDSERLVNALDMFMASDLGKTMPFTSLSSIENVNTSLSATHQLCILTQDPSVIDNMDDKFKNPEAMILGMAWNEEAKVKSSVLGSPLIMNPAGLSNVFSNVYSINVKDPVAFGAAFSTFTKAFPAVTLELHEAISGAENHVTHYVVTRAANLSEWLKNRETINSSKAFADFVASVDTNLEVINSMSMRVLKNYNMPGQ